ncbi:MAG TPA: hypothetical protein VM716_07590 [Gemmatimonadales bacterium]|nr:hypothetical protein [Gemmatimonadales bacterium]
MLALGLACHLDAVLHPPTGGGGPGAGGGPGQARVGIDQLEQVQSDSVTPIPIGGSAPAASIVLRALVHDTASTGRHMEIELQPAGTPFQDQPTGQSDPTSDGKTAYVSVTGLADNTSYHWQARLEGETTWRPYSGSGANVVDFRVALPPPTKHLVFSQQPTSTGAGATMAPVAVTMVDGQNSTLTSFTGNIHLDISPNANPGGAGLGGQQDVNAVAGVATFSNLIMTKAGSGYRLEATADGIGPVTSSSFGIAPGPGNHPKFLVQPSNTKSNVAITPPVQLAILDVYDNVATSYNYVVWCVMANDGSPGKNATLAASGTGRAPNAGIVTYEDLRIDKVGTGYTLSCAGTSIHPEISAPFDVTQ